MKTLETTLPTELTLGPEGLLVVHVVGEPTQAELHIEVLHSAIEELEAQVAELTKLGDEDLTDFLAMFDAVVKCNEELAKQDEELSRLRHRNRNQRIELKRLNQAHVNKSFRIMKQDIMLDALEEVVESFVK